MTNSILRGAQTGLACVLLIGLQAPAVLAQDAMQPGYQYPAQGYADPANNQPEYASPAYDAQQYADPAYAQPGYAPQGYADPANNQPEYASPAYDTQQYADPAYAQPGYAAQDYADPAYSQPGYASPAYDSQQYADPAYYGAQGYPADPQYTYDQGYMQQGVAPAPVYSDPGYAAPAADPQVTYDAQGYPVQSYAPGAGYDGMGYAMPSQGYAVQNDPGYYIDPYVDQYADPNMGQMSMNPGLRRDGDGNQLPPMFNSWEELYTTDNPWYDPRDTRGYWADPDFRPWSTGPFAKDGWDDIHPMSNMPWGNFPGWSDGPFGGFGPESWEGVTPWGNDVPFKWVDPTDPRAMIGDIWDDALNTPNRMGRMPPGWTAPYISVPNPIDVEEEFERNARNFPDEMRKAINTGDSEVGGTAEPRYKDSKDEKQKRDAKKGVDKPKPEEKPWVKPMAPVKPYGQGFSRTPR